MKKRNAFTLAEVLITLGIIGVVAAMTMPTLMNSTNGAQYKTAYKKALSVLSQAVVLNVALDDYDMSQASATDATATNGTSASMYNLFNNRMNVVKTGSGKNGEATWTVAANTTNKTPKVEFGTSANYTLFFNDGIVFTFPKNAANCADANAAAGIGNNRRCYGAIDVNGEKNPNKVVSCDSGTQGDNCKVSNPTDIYPVVMYDQTILPATRAAEAVLYGAGK